MNCGIHGSRSGPVAWGTSAGYLENQDGDNGLGRKNRGNGRAEFFYPDRQVREGERARFT